MIHEVRESSGTVAEAKRKSVAYKKTTKADVEYFASQSHGLGFFSS